jgi:hypothetical protein
MSAWALLCTAGCLEAGQGADGFMPHRPLLCLFGGFCLVGCPAYGAPTFLHHQPDQHTVSTHSQLAGWFPLHTSWQAVHVTAQSCCCVCPCCVAHAAECCSLCGFVSIVAAAESLVTVWLCFFGTYVSAVVSLTTVQHCTCTHFT